MKKILLAFAALAFALPFTAMAQPVALATGEQTHYSRQELKKMVEEAHSSQQYQALADYFHQQESYYRTEAASEKMEWDRRAQVSLGGASLKIPNPTDSARRLYESYSYDADHNSDLAHHYEQLAAAAQNKS